jgi:hypothetical protein
MWILPIGDHVDALFVGDVDDRLSDLSMQTP